MTFEHFVRGSHFHERLFTILGTLFSPCEVDSSRSSIKKLSESKILSKLSASLLNSSSHFDAHLAADFIDPQTK